MIAVIVLMDQLIWRPVIAWSEKFKFEQVEAAQSSRSPILDLLRRSRLVHRAARVTVAPAREAVALYFARKRRAFLPRAKAGALNKGITGLVLTVAFFAIFFALVKM